MRISIFLVCFLLFPTLLPAVYAADDHPIGIIGATDEEISHFKNELIERQVRLVNGFTLYTGKLNGQNAIVAKSGTGKVNAAMATTVLITHFDPRLIISTGVAGALDPELRPGDLVIARKTGQHDLGVLHDTGRLENRGATSPNGEEDPIFFAAGAELVKLAESTGVDLKLNSNLFTKGDYLPRIQTGVIISGDVFVVSSDAKRQLRDRLDGDAVEMEAAVTAQICHQFSVPYLAIRGIGDSAAAGNAYKEYGIGRLIAAKHAAVLIKEMLKKLQSGR